MKKKSNRRKKKKIKKIKNWNSLRSICYFRVCTHNEFGQDWKAVVDGKPAKENREVNKSIQKFKSKLDSLLRCIVLEAITDEWFSNETKKTKAITFISFSYINVHLLLFILPCFISNPRSIPFYFNVVLLCHHLDRSQQIILILNFIVVLSWINEKMKI